MRVTILTALFFSTACSRSLHSTVDGGADSDGGLPDLAMQLALDFSVLAEPADFGLDNRPANPTCVAPARPVQNTLVTVVPAFNHLTFSLPIELRQAPGDSSRWFLAQKGGKVRVFANDENTTQVSDFVDITARVNSGPNEAGLLGMAFHPNFSSNHFFFLSYTAYSGSSPVNLRSTVSRFSLKMDGSGDAATESKIFPPNDNSPNVLDQPYENHNGGNIVFGPDGDLYYGLGDGGSGGDPENRAQNLSLFFGKILRVDVDHAPNGKRYGIPSDNPLASNGGAPELFAWGLRNPWRFSFDRATSQLWVGDVGQNLYEEVDVVGRGGNYGWRQREGMHCYNPGTGCQTAGMIEPIVEYPHSNGASRSVTGGYVYRGSAIPSLIGRYVYADEVNGDLYAIAYDAMGQASQTLLTNMSGVNASSFAEGSDGELYVLNYGSGKILKIVPAGVPLPDTFPKVLSATGCVDPNDARRPSAGLMPYDVNAPLWSDGADKQRWLALPDGATIHFGADGDWDLPLGSVVMKQFSIASTLVETRLFMRHSDGNWAGYSYEWNDAGTDATLLPAGKTKLVAGQSWTYPSRSDCLTCHTAAAGRTLGLETGQLNRNFAYPSTARLSNQLTTLDHIGVFDAPIGDAQKQIAYPTYDGNEAIDQRARAYLHGNCSYCHRPNSTGQGPADYRFSTSLSATMACNALPQETNLGVNGARLILPGDHEKSLVSLRMHALDVNRMPPLASTVVDAQGAKLVDAFIDSLTACP